MNRVKKVLEKEGSVEENTNTETLVRRLLSTDYADKVIVTTIQKLGLALDGTYKKNYKERLEPLSQKRMVFRNYFMKVMKTILPFLCPDSCHFYARIYFSCYHKYSLSCRFQYY